MSGCVGGLLLTNHMTAHGSNGSLKVDPCPVLGWTPHPLLYPPEHPYSELSRLPPGCPGPSPPVVVFIVR